MMALPSQQHGYVIITSSLCNGSSMTKPSYRHRKAIFGSSLCRRRMINMQWQAGIA
ncbi:MAG: hypothetical protein IJ421_00685 [Prevotella sp.]|nr:hypothetical protein [Prevotella sp.]MEE1091681.1 hypothetical protein [Prevotella sp.]